VTCPCPTCRTPVRRDPTRPNKLCPFCSERCHLVDLGRWLGEDYRIPSGPSSDALEALGESGDDE
jgi:endogenous inhibitor of DNA gyrase (YacG/DUF329 family)